MSRKRLLVWLVAALACAYAQGSSTDSSSSWQQNPPRPDAPGYRGEPPRRPEQDGYYQRQEPDDWREPPPRPPPESSYNPIHYQFPSADERPKRMRDDGHDSIPRTELNGPERPHDDDDDDRKYASPRNDIITRFMSTKRGRTLLTLSSGTVGMGLGSFVGKSLLNRPKPFAVSFFVAFMLCTYFRNPYGELSRALGMALILALQRTRAIRRRYPAWKHVKACIGAGPRCSTDDDSEEYQMLYMMIAMAFIGSACGGNLPLVPTWMGATAGAASFAFFTTLPSARGDLARTMGMRVVSLVEEVLVINSELRMMGKLGVVSSKVLDKMLVLDRKHRIKDRLVAAFSWAYDHVSRTAAQVQSDIRDDDEPPRRPDEPRRRPPPQQDDSSL